MTAENSIHISFLDVELNGKRSIYQRTLHVNVNFVRFNHKSKIIMFLKLVSFQSDILIHVNVNFVRFNHKSKIFMFLKLVSFQSM